MAALATIRARSRLSTTTEPLAVIPGLVPSNSGKTTVTGIG